MWGCIKLQFFISNERKGFSIERKKNCKIHEARTFPRQNLAFAINRLTFRIYDNWMRCFRFRRPTEWWTMDENWRSLFSHNATNGLIVHSEPIGIRKMWNAKKMRMNDCSAEYLHFVGCFQRKATEATEKISKRDRINVFTVQKKINKTDWDSMTFRKNWKK